MKWNKLEVKPLPIEEQTEHSYKTRWEGPVPEINEEDIIYNYNNFNDYIFWRVCNSNRD